MAKRIVKPLEVSENGSYEPGLTCGTCGRPHAVPTCDNCGASNPQDHILSCDYCGAWSPLDVVALVRVRVWRVIAGMATAFAVGALAGAAVRRK